MKMIINGEELKSENGETLSRENPSMKDETVATVEITSLNQLEMAVETAKEIFEKNKYAWTTDHKQRERILYKAGSLIREKKDELVNVLVKEIGMPRRQAEPHVLSAADIFEFYAGYATKIYGESMSISNGDFIALVKEPVGVSALITPWNFPLTQSARKIAPALAAGCTVVYKPSSYSPVSGYLITKILYEAGLPKGVLNLVFGKGSKIGDLLIKNKKVDKISFTGSTAVGKNIAKLASDDLKRVSLELGGKNPFIIFEDANLDIAAYALIYGTFRNSGQACGSTSRLIVQENIKDKFLGILNKKIERIKVGNPEDTKTDMGPLVSSDQFKKVQEYLKYAEDEKRKIIKGGIVLDSDLAKLGYFVQPTIVDSVDVDSKLFREEIFGPVLSVSTFKNENDAVDLANNSIYGLTAALWTKDVSRSIRLARKIRAGTVWINDNYAQPPEGIWGGFKESGYGRELSHFGLDDFLEIKQIYVNTVDTIKPWYRQLIDEK